MPPTLYALLQFESIGRVFGIFVGVGAIQFVVGNFIDPKVEGRVLSLSAVAVLFAIVFWGWVWGPFGALLAVPITAALAIVADHIPGTRWIAALVASVRPGESGPVDRPAAAPVDRKAGAG